MVSAGLACIHVAPGRMDGQVHSSDDHHHRPGEPVQLPGARRQRLVSARTEPRGQAEERLYLQEHHLVLLRPDRYQVQNADSDGALVELHAEESGDAGSCKPGKVLLRNT